MSRGGQPLPSCWICEEPASQRVLGRSICVDCLNTLIDLVGEESFGATVRLHVQVAEPELPLRPIKLADWGLR